MNISFSCRCIVTKSSLHSQSETEKALKKFQSYIIGLPLIPVEDVPEKDLLDNVYGILFKYMSTPGVVPERAYLSNSSDQKQMSDETRYKFGKLNFPVKVITYYHCINVKFMKLEYSNLEKICDYKNWVAT